MLKPIFTKLQRLLEGEFKIAVVIFHSIRNLKLELVKKKFNNLILFIVV